MYCFVFPGQGSQSVGMGYEVYKAFPEAKEVFEEVDEALGQKLSKLIFEGPLEDLTLTENAQPALMAVSMAFIHVLKQLGNLNISQLAYCVAGHSLGEYAALTAAGVLKLSDTARLLRTRGWAMQEAVPLGQGSMAAILGLDIQDVASIVQNAAQGQVCVVANDNAPGQVVISGHKEAVERAMELATQKGAKRSILLPVSAPFHCPLMGPAETIMAETLNKVTFSKALVPVITNVTAKFETNPEVLQKSLVEQVTGQVRWRETIESLSQYPISEVVEVGAGKVLTGLTKRINSELKAVALNTPQDIEAFLKLLP
ncbi:MAG: ACP S-malonyltransferase [Alphaproteobacteria bacterium]|nr:ACP S-malonyltransferase [Alphaproteobacteria bacterium]